jgi:hypothetical protein
MRLSALAAAVFATTLAAAPAAAGSSVRIDVRDEDGDRFNLSIGTGLVSGFVRAFAPISIDCDEDRDDDPKVRELFRALERAGEPSRGTLDSGDEFLDARRDRGLLHLTVTDDDGEEAKITMPWNLARCVLGGETISRGELAAAFESGDFSIRVEDDEETVRIDIE